MSQDTPPKAPPPILADEPVPEARSALQREVEAGHDGTTTIEALGRTWVVPVKQHMKHIARIRNGLLAGYGNWGLLVAETFLDSAAHPGVGADGKPVIPKGQVEELYELNPTEEDLDDFAKKLSKAIAGVETPGNS